MTTKWQPGVLAVIMVSEWQRNRYRVVELVEPQYGGHGKRWFVRDPNGVTLDGYRLATGKLLEARVLGVAQWKLRLLDQEYDELVELNGTYFCLKGTAA